MQSAKSFNALFKLIPFASRMFPGITEALKKLPELEQQATVLLLPDLFNDAFSQHGWIAYESMSIEAMVRALAVEKEHGIVAAEQTLADCYDEATLKFGIMRLTGHAEFRKRLRLVELAKVDYLEERYHACVPLLLSLVDGLANDISRHLGFFAAGTNMTAWDSIAAHESGLKALAQIMGKGRNKTNENEISLPYRNGILHGRELAFDNKVVAAKCWGVLFAVRDWAGALADGKATPKPNEKPTWGQLLRQVADTQRRRKALDAWRPRTAAELHHLPAIGVTSFSPADTPERTVAEFLENWCNLRYGPMAEALLYFVDISKGKKAKRAKDDFGGCTPMAYTVIAVTDETAAISQVEADIVLNREQEKTVRVSIRLIYSDSASNAVIRGHEAGSWKIVQNGFSSMIYPH